MEEELEFRTDLYRGTAPFYDRFRLSYPESLVRDLVARVGASGNGRLLDLGCGTGQITFALCDHFAEVWAVDQEPETIAFTREKAEIAGVGNVRWMTGRAEDVDPDVTFDLVTAGNAFHRLPRRRVAERAMQWLRPGGHCALLWGGNPTDGSAPWQQELVDITRDWLQRAGSEDRIPAAFEQELAEHPHASILRDAGLAIVGRYNFTQEHEWTVDALIGFMYSTSILSLLVLGNRRAAFATDVRERLCAFEPSGVFRDDVSFSYDLARRP